MFFEQLNRFLHFSRSFYFDNFINVRSNSTYLGPELILTGGGTHDVKGGKEGAKVAVNALYASKPRNKDEVRR